MFYLQNAKRYVKDKYNCIGSFRVGRKPANKRRMDVTRHLNAFSKILSHSILIDIHSSVTFLGT